MNNQNTTNEDDFFVQRFINYEHSKGYESVNEQIDETVSQLAILRRLYEKVILCNSGILFTDGEFFYEKLMEIYQDINNNIDDRYYGLDILKSLYKRTHKRYDKRHPAMIGLKHAINVYNQHIEILEEVEEEYESFFYSCYISMN